MDTDTKGYVYNKLSVDGTRVPTATSAKPVDAPKKINAIKTESNVPANYREQLMVIDLGVEHTGVALYKDYWKLIH